MRNTPLKIFAKSPLNKDKNPILESIKKDIKENDPFPGIAIGKDIAEATEKSLKTQAKDPTIPGFRKI
tara:strand:+ start:302 stop:505 length:204 start_codon:yes stop_codon:yes gene_type:complete